MIGTAPTTQGGISSVVRALEAGGLFARCGVDYLATHTDGSTWRKLAIAVRAWLAYLPRLLGGRVALLHVHVSSRASFWRKSAFILPTRLLGVPYVLHLHGSEFHLFTERECGPRRRRFIRWVFERAARVVVLSPGWRTWVATQFPKARVQVIYNPVALPTACAQPGQSGAVLFLGRLGERKGVFHLIAAAAGLAPAFADLRLWLGGDGAVETARQQAAALGLAERVELLGWVTGADKASRLQRAALFALPSYNEGLPMSVLEAMSYGLPVLATPVGGIPDAIEDGVEGFLVPPGDEAALADRMRRLLADPDLRQRMGEAARRKVARLFSTEVVVPQFEALYAELLGAEALARVAQGQARQAPDA